MHQGPSIYSQINLNERPFIVIWEVTRACDLACVHCRASAIPWRNPFELSTAEGRRLIDQVTEFGHPYPLLILTGGDPMKRPDIYELVRYGAQKGLKVGLSPSATPLLTGEAIRRLKEEGLSRMAISLDGSCPEIHDDFRKVPGSFERTVQAAETARSVGLGLQINTTVTRKNLEDLDRIFELLTHWKVELWSVFFLVTIGRAKADLQISAREFEQVFARLYRWSKIAEFDIKTTEAQHYRRYVLQQEGPQGLVKGDGAGLKMGRAPLLGINDGKGFVFISHIGEVCPSGFLPLAGGNVREDTLVNIYRNSPLFRQIRDYDQLKGKCGMCDYKGVCGGSRARAYAMTGDFMASDPYCIYQPLAYLESRKQVSSGRRG